MRILSVSLSFLVFLSLGSVQATAIRADDGQIAISDSPVTRIRWGNDDEFDNPPIIPGPTYHLMFSDPGLVEKKVIKKISQFNSHTADGDGADSDRPVHYQARYTGGSRPNAVAPTDTTVFEITTTGSSPFRSYRLGRLGSSNSLRVRSTPSFGGTRDTTSMPVTGAVNKRRYGSSASRMDGLANSGTF